MIINPILEEYDEFFDNLFGRRELLTLKSQHGFGTLAIFNISRDDASWVNT